MNEKVIVMTGAAEGIGETYACSVRRRGTRVALADVNVEKAAGVAAAIRAYGGSAESFAVDVADEASTLALSAAVVDRFGGVDHLVNNAGIHYGLRMEPMLTVDFEYYRRVMAVNLDGAYLCTRAFHRHLADRGGRDREPLVDGVVAPRWLLLVVEGGDQQSDCLPRRRARPPRRAGQRHRAWHDRHRGDAEHGV